MSTKILISLPFESIKDFEEHQRRIISDVVTGINNSKKSEPEYLTRKEVARLLKISLVTLNEWCKNGVIQSYRIGNRVLFKRADVDEALIKVNSLKYRR